ncbi:Arginase-1 [Dactylella cylindrospora]|nr:Arginase-1 [Dactylella cylindrospora]
MPPTKVIDVLGVPTEAGTHFAGQSKAPAAILSAGLPDSLSSIGYKVNVDENIFLDSYSVQRLWQPSPKINGVRNEANTIAVMQAITDKLANIDINSRFPLIIGGDCSITPAILTGLLRGASRTPNDPDTPPKLGIIYFDGDADLTLPSQAMADGGTGILDSMVMTHLTQRSGALSSMAHFARPDGGPLANPNNIVLFGFDPEQLAQEHWVYLLENQYKCFTRDTVQKSPVASAQAAIDYLTKSDQVDCIFLHFDVDVIDSGMFPLANYPHYKGLGVDEAVECLRLFSSCENVVGMVVTEANPNNDPSGEMVRRLVQELLGGFTARLSFS